MNKKLFRDCLFLVIYAVLLVVVLLNLNMITGVVGAVLAVLTPLFIGIIIALILNIPYMYTNRFICLLYTSDSFQAFFRFCRLFSEF